VERAVISGFAVASWFGRLQSLIEPGDKRHVLSACQTLPKHARDTRLIVR
jgi:hypothetical protein